MKKRIVSSIVSCLVAVGLATGSTAALAGNTPLEQCGIAFHQIRSKIRKEAWRVGQIACKTGDVALALKKTLKKANRANRKFNAKITKAGGTSVCDPDLLPLLLADEIPPNVWEDFVKSETIDPLDGSCNGVLDNP